MIYQRILRGALALIGTAAIAGCVTPPHRSGAPLGSQANPVRADQPQGQRAYLDRLRCTNGRPPRYERAGNFGPGPYRTIIDGYEVECAGSAPASVMIFMDMYHRGHQEDEAVPGFTIVNE
ncbi:MAG: hypothetical protein AAGE05_14585 [Pseudomonadota bacterium]